MYTSHPQRLYFRMYPGRQPGTFAAAHGSGSESVGDAWPSKAASRNEARGIRSLLSVLAEPGLSVTACSPQGRETPGRDDDNRTLAETNASASATSWMQSSAEAAVNEEFRQQRGRLLTRVEDLHRLEHLPVGTRPLHLGGWRLPARLPAAVARRQLAPGAPASSAPRREIGRAHV